VDKVKPEKELKEHLTKNSMTIYELLNNVKVSHTFLGYNAIVAGSFWRRGERKCSCRRKTEANAIYCWCYICQKCVEKRAQRCDHEMTSPRTSS
jgi:hypothetical protein